MDSSKQKTPTTPLDPDEQLAKLGARIKELRIKAGYSNYEVFAYEHNIPRAQYGRYEQGKDLRFSSLVKVVSAFGMTMEEFFGEGF
ncbi:Helix-turn-helix [Chitinophaga jiangningensis]|uniref:Helix-turn-helix n=1 Tax=Chitinophaga jiangningensis TaxID=1419482 RepID=A0A1M7ECI7_9BACT|nr:helix-turn-helix transcriptional regulator [Chitinophaga jiangningensis]SHL89356.1 Helix-turn-helix [Chitinophaga jiangningensis]